MGPHKKLVPKMLALGAAAALALAACSGSGGITVGSKDFTEQSILGQMLVIALEDAGYDVTDETNLAGTSVVRSALESGDVDMYWEYTGTAWAEILGQEEVVSDSQELYERVKARDAKNGIVWGARGSFDNTYAIAQSAEVAAEYGVTTLTELGELSQSNPDAATVCVAEEFAGRQDGWPGLKEAYGLQIPDANTALLTEGLIYDQVAEAPGSDCNFGEVFTTDGRIQSMNLEVLEDDQNFFPIYNPAITVREEVAQENPEVVEIANDIITRLDTETMQELNLRSDGEEGVPHDQVAREWLESEGLIGGSE